MPLILTDKEAIDKVQSKHQQLSLGYVASLDWTPGKASAGEDYDCVQQNIRANHLAVVEQARGGPLLRLGDAVFQDEDGSDPVKQAVRATVAAMASDASRVLPRHRCVW